MFWGERLPIALLFIDKKFNPSKLFYEIVFLLYEIDFSSMHNHVVEWQKAKGVECPENEGIFWVLFGDLEGFCNNLLQERGNLEKSMHNLKSSLKSFPPIGKP